GSLVGGYGSRFLTEPQIDVVYAVLAAIAAIMMFVPKKEVPFTEGDELHFNRTLASSLAFVTCAAAGIVGAAGAFILLPIMLVLVSVPTRGTVATSLAVSLISFIGTTIGLVVINQLLYGTAFIMVIASLIAAHLVAKSG